MLCDEFLAQSPEQKGKSGFLRRLAKILADHAKAGQHHVSSRFPLGVNDDLLFAPCMLAPGHPRDEREDPKAPQPGTRPDVGCTRDKGRPPWESCRGSTLRSCGSQAQSTQVKSDGKASHSVSRAGTTGLCGGAAGVSDGVHWVACSLAVVRLAGSNS